MIVAVSAIVTAIIALVVGVWENVQEREHNRLSVLPSLVLTLEATRSGNPNDDQKAPVVSVRLANNGVGPAVVQRLAITAEPPEGEVQHVENISNAAPALRELGIQLGTRAEISSGTVIGVGQDLVLAQLRFIDAPPDAEAYPLVEALLERFQIVIDYQSIYGEPFTTSLDR